MNSSSLPFAAQSPNSITNCELQCWVKVRIPVGHCLSGGYDRTFPFSMPGGFCFKLTPHSVFLLTCLLFSPPFFVPSTHLSFLLRLLSLGCFRFLAALRVTCVVLYKLQFLNAFSLSLSFSLFSSPLLFLLVPCTIFVPLSLGYRPAYYCQRARGGS